MTLSALPNAAAAVTDSIFTWTFRATGGDSWGGLLVEDSTRYVVGSTLGTAHGSYTIVAAAPQGTDLGTFGMEEGWISVGWYRDSTGVWMLTRLGEATAAGFAGLGSEVDAAWTGTAWDSFGLGGADQADVDNLADSLFTWSFTAHGGDMMFGTLLGKGAAWAVGDTLATAHGVYQILTRAALGQDQAQAAAAGTVHTTRYYDAAARTDFVLESGGAGPTGYAGLGSELDRAWTGSAWVLVGQGGALQADRIPDVVVGWTYLARNGDTYTGHLIGHSTAWEVGDQVVMPRGSYTITSETSLGGQIFADATVWTTGGYFDHSASRLLPSYSSAVLNGAPSGYAGLGSEYDYAWNGRVWDDYGRAGAVLASVEPSAIFRWRFDASNGDYYTGWVIQNLDVYDPGDVIATAHGRYTIETEDPWAGSQAFGTVWTHTYFDASANQLMPTYRWSTLGGVPSGGNGLGSEYDHAWDGRAFSDFGLGGANLASVIRSQVFTWRFDAHGGDSYNGWLIENFETYNPGDIINTSHGRYTIEAEDPWSGSQAFGTVWTYTYFDASANQLMPTYRWSTLGGVPSGGSGLGSEYDLAWDGRAFSDFGLGGANLASAIRSQVFTWRFDAHDGDYYTGWLIENFETYNAGDIINTPHGRYTIQAENAWTGSQAFGTVWTHTYFDASANQLMPTYRWSTLGGVPSGSNGLGSEYDHAWDGRAFSDFGLGGANLANVIRSQVFTWRFDAHSGDSYNGWLIENFETYDAGDIINTPHGRYTIEAEDAWSGTQAFGTVWTHTYFDASANQQMPTYFWTALGGVPSGSRGLGSEADFAWNGRSFSDFGQGGARQAFASASTSGGADELFG